jgi:hypothetical protein
LFVFSPGRANPGIQLAPAKKGFNEHYGLVIIGIQQISNITFTILYIIIFIVVQ